jgi:hypothetical protein
LPTTKAVPVETRPQAVARTTSVLSAAASAIRAAWASVGGSTGAAGNGSSPMKTSGRPVVSSHDASWST